MSRENLFAYPEGGDIVDLRRRLLGSLNLIFVQQPDGSWPTGVEPQRLWLHNEPAQVLAGAAADNEGPVYVGIVRLANKLPDDTPHTYGSKGYFTILVSSDEWFFDAEPANALPGSEQAFPIEADAMTLEVLGHASFTFSDVLTTNFRLAQGP